MTTLPEPRPAPAPPRPAAPRVRPGPGASAPSPTRPPATGRSKPPALRGRAVGGLDFWRHGFPVLLAVLILAIPLLAWTGWNIILDSNDGDVRRSESDPDAPGYEAVVEPTPTLLAVHVREGTAVGATLLVLSGDTSGAVVVVPIETVFELDGAPQSLADAYEAGGLEAARQGAEAAVGVAMTEAVELSDASFASLVGPVAPLTVDNPDPVVVEGADGDEVLFPAGETSLAAADVGAFVGTPPVGVEVINQLLRHELFWTAWLEAIGERGDGAVPGEGGTGIARFLSGLGGGEWLVERLPGDQVPLVGEDTLLFQPDDAGVRDLVEQVVPFPQGVPAGSRLRVRLLDGTGQLDHGLPAAGLVLAGGGEVTVIGNAATFGETATRVIYGDPALADQVRELVRSLGVGEAVEGVAGDAATDVTVVLGADAIEVLAVRGTTTEGGGGGTDDGD
jgi:hypothetical protein